MIVSPARFAAVSLGMLGALTLAGTAGASMPLALAGAVVLIIAVPVWLVLAYLSAVRMAHHGAMLTRPVWWLWLGHPLRCVVAVVPALAAGAGVAAALIGQGVPALGWIAVTALAVFGVARSPIVARTSARYRPYARHRPVVGLAVCGAAAVMAIVAALTGVVPGGGDLSAAVAAEPRYTGSSVIVAQTVDLIALWTGAQVWGTGWAVAKDAPGWMIVLWRIAAGFGYFLGVALAMAAGLVPGAELRRILLPTDTDLPKAPGAATVVMAAAVAAVLAIGYFQMLAGLEAWVAVALGPVQTETAVMMPASADAGDRTPGLATDLPPVKLTPFPLSPAAIRQMVEAEAIGTLQCPPGTIAAVEALDAEFAAILADQQDRLRAASVAGFDRVRANVPGFLDWYYSLEAEYLRTANLLVGSGVTYLDQQLRTQLVAGGPLADLELAVAALAANPVLADVFAVNRVGLLSGCGPAIPRDDSAVIQVARRPEALLTTVLPDAAISFETRIASSGLGGLAAGAIAGVVTAKIGAKILAKGIFTAAAEAVVRIAGGKAISVAGGMLIGAGTGAAGGSVVPGAGTTAGAIIGGIAGGVAVMLGVDFTLVKLDEAISRPDFEAEIIAAIDAAEAELLESLGIAVKAEN